MKAIYSMSFPPLQIFVKDVVRWSDAEHSSVVSVLQ